MNQLIPISAVEDIPKTYQNTPIGHLLAYHNLQRPFDSYSKAKLLIGTCMDHRVQLRFPKNFAYVLRSGGANLQHSGFKISFAVAVGGVKSFAIIGHTDCGMVNVRSKEEQFVQGLVERAGWDHDDAVEHFNSLEPEFEIHNEIIFVLHQTKQLRLRYPKVLVAPILYKVEDDLLYLIDEDSITNE
jgi:carbonic anhydrase